MAAIFTSDSYDGRYLQLVVNETINVVANTSTLNWTLTSAGGTSPYYTIDATKVTIAGVTVYSKDMTYWSDRVFPAATGSVSGSITVLHNSDGTGSIAIGFSTRVYIYGPLEYGGNMILTNIDRTAPTVSCSVSDVTASSCIITANSSATADLWEYSMDGGSSWTQFSTIPGSSATVARTGLSANTIYSVRTRARKQSNHVYGTSATVSVSTQGGAVINSCPTITADASTVTLSPNVTVYDSDYTHYLTIFNGSTMYLALTGRTWSTGTAARTITLTDAERTELLEAMAEVKSFTATIQLVTMDGSTQVSIASTCTCTIQTTEANSGPSITAFTYKDSRSTTAALTGNDQVFIQGYSYLYVTPGTATAKNGASIVKYSATCNGKTASNTSGAALNLYEVYASGTLDVVVTATDSRGYTASVTQQIMVIPYAKPKVSEISLRRTNDIGAEMQLVFSGSISSITVDGAEKNSLLEVQYRYKLTSASSYGSYTSILADMSQTGTSFSFSNLELCSLDANSSYDFHLYIRDQLNTLSALDLYFTVPQGTPLVALRKKMVGINTPEPEAALHVVGDARIEGTLTPDAIDYTFDKPYFGTCDTAASTALKVVTCDEFVLKKGTLLAVLFTNANTASSVNMNVNGTGVKAVCGLNGYYVQANMWVANQVVHFVYNGTWWIALNCLTATTVRYGLTMLSNSTSSTSISLAATPYAVKQAYDRNSWDSISLTQPLAIGYGGTGGITAEAARANLGISCTNLYTGTFTSGNMIFGYGSYKMYVILGRPTSTGSLVSLVVPMTQLTTTATAYQIADETNYKSFYLSYSGTTVTLTMGNGNGQINAVFGVN